MKFIRLFPKIILYSAYIHYTIYLFNDPETSFYQAVFILFLIGASAIIIELERFN